MKKDEMLKIEERMLSDVYNLILSENIAEDERKLLLDFKNNIGDYKKFEKNIENLSEKIRCLSINKYNKKQSLTEEFAIFYKKISSKGLFDREVGRGIASIGIWI